MKWVSIKVFLIELVCKRKATEPLASVPFAPCPPFPSSLLGKREAEHGVKSCLHSPCPAALHSPIPAAPDRDSLLLLQLTAPERGDAGRAAKEEKRVLHDVHTLLRWAELWGAKCFAPALLDFAWHGISFQFSSCNKHCTQVRGGFCCLGFFNDEGLVLICLFVCLFVS